jgi:phosphatidate phosphatase APP1
VHGGTAPAHKGDFFGGEEAGGNSCCVFYSRVDFHIAVIAAYATAFPPLRCMQIARRETSLLFPSYGRYVAERDVWRVAIQGALIADAPLSFGKRVLLRLLQRWIDDPAAVMENPVFQSRTRYFLARPLKRKRVQVLVGPRIVALPKRTNKNGLFTAHVELPRRWVEQHAEEGVLRLRISTAEAEETQEIRLLPPQGLSVISDIDDTIKHTDVSSRRELLANTFLRPFQSIPGMADRYQEWQRHGAAFHYVSASPWQLVEELQTFREAAGFPAGAMHLRSFRMREHMVRRLLRLPPAAKYNAIKNLLRAFPHRRFVLVGDSGEYDPEIYGKLARRFPSQISSIFIRDLDRRPIDGRRMQKAFRRLPKTLVKRYISASDLPSTPPC